MVQNALKDLSKDELLTVIEMFSRNWLTLDGLWFTLVEDKFGLDAALELDLKMWQRQALAEALRIKKYLGIEGGGVKGVLKALRFMTFDPAMPFACDLDESVDESGQDSAHLWITSCRPQEGRMRTGRGEFPCKLMGVACYGTLAKTIDPSVTVECVFCPPDRHPADAWCKWKFTGNGKPAER